jgi:3-oxoacyl-[acyl-carrier-protein] synthase III
MKAAILGVAAHIPQKVVSNRDLESALDTTDEWIFSRTGIRERRIFDLQDTQIKSSDLGIQVAKNLFESTQTSPHEIDAIICGSMYPDYVFPATACVIQAGLGCKNAFAYDLTAACAFVPFALQNASALVETAMAKKVLVIGAELSSRVVDWNDRNTSVLFGDAAGAFLIGPGQEKGLILSSSLGSDGSLANILYLEKGTKSDPRYLFMDGKAVFKTAVQAMTSVAQKVMQKAGRELSEVRYIIPHQANIRIINAVAEKLGFREDQIIANVHKYGNTSSASIPLVLAEAVAQQKIARGDLILLPAIGGGMSWGCTLVQW